MSSFVTGVVFLCLTGIDAQESKSATSLAIQAGVRGRYLGVAGWEITDGKTVILIDPYISRLSGPPGDGSPAPPGWPGKLSFSDLAEPDTAAVDRHT